VTEAVDQEARDLANRAIAMIAAHERVCEERSKSATTWRESTTSKLSEIENAIGERLTAMSKAISTVYNRMWIAMCGLVVTLVTVIGYLIAHKGL
jgi:DNA anti-recombination protein RmuC